MKKSIVLCEGKTDQILLSYYFNKKSCSDHFIREKWS